MSGATGSSCSVNFQRSKRLKIGRKPGPSSKTCSRGCGRTAALNHVASTSSRVFAVLGSAAAHLAGGVLPRAAGLSRRADFLERSKLPGPTRRDSCQLDEILTTDYVWDAFFRSVALSGSCALIATILAFPLAYFVAFRISLRARLLATCLLIVPFFTSYLVRVYTWRTMLGLHGAVNALLTAVGLPPQ